jgi:hypothetical protein
MTAGTPSEGSWVWKGERFLFCNAHGDWEYRRSETGAWEFWVEGSWWPSSLNTKYASDAEVCAAYEGQDPNCGGHDG